ncbi:MAG: hypothetical protein WA728_33500 [Xanthobacteraceae bacterium]
MRFDVAGIVSKAFRFCGCTAPLPGWPADFRKFIADETENGAKVVKFAGIKVE